MDYCNDACSSVFGRPGHAHGKLCDVQLAEPARSPVTAQDRVKPIVCTIPTRATTMRPLRTTTGRATTAARLHDATACNYNPNATEDDGSCTYPAEGFPAIAQLIFRSTCRMPDRSVSKTIEATATDVSSLPSNWNTRMYPRQLTAPRSCDPNGTHWNWRVQYDVRIHRCRGWPAAEHRSRWNVYGHHRPRRLRLTGRGLDHRPRQRLVQYHRICFWTGPSLVDGVPWRIRTGCRRLHRRHSVQLQRGRDD